jgi:teichuronic acid biosynthesis glycosyltransferase TuaG
MKKVSIIIPYYKNINFFPQTINSIKNQSFKDYEIIIIYDDSSKAELQNIKQILKSCKNVKIIINKKNLGAGLSRNKGANVAKGKYLAFIDSDDLWHKEKLSHQLKFMKKKKIDLSFTSYWIINSNNKIISYRPVKKITTYKDLINSCDIGLSTAIIKRSLFLKNKFSSNKTKEDYSLWLRLSKNMNIYGFNKKLTKWRKLNNSLSSNTIQKLYDAYNIYHRQEKFSIINSLFRVFILSCNFVKKSLHEKKNFFN